MIQADIVNIGDELLIGQVVNTNASWMAALLNEHGIQVRQMHTVADSKDAIKKAVADSMDAVDIVLVTGGLGPTKDDITKHTLAEFFGSKSWYVHEPSLQVIQELLSRRGVPISELNRKQAELPDSCKAILNRKGTAPGMWFEQQGKVLVSMAGVPFEMKGIMQDVMPMLRERFLLDSIYHKTMLTYGIPESVLAEKIEDWENQLPDKLKLAYLPSPESGVKLRLSAYGGEQAQLKVIVEKEFTKLLPMLGSNIYGWDDESLESVVGKLLRNNKLSVSTAESCTGGKIASLITRIPGSSDYFKGAVVAYDNKVKQQLLGVAEADLNSVGAVSKEVVEQMALGARKTLSTDYAIATSGIAGPDGGTPEKPVGTVWIAIATPEKVVSQKHVFSHDRELVVSRAAAVALNMLRLVLIGAL